MGNRDRYQTAEELAAQQREISIAEFFEQNRQMLGFGSRARAMVTAVKEGVDNSIDAAEEAGILPEVRVTITETDDGHYSVTITDNGPGITKQQVPKVFGKLLYGSRFARRVQSRGQQGIGISAAVMYAQNTTGKPAEVTSKTADSESAEYFSVGIDTDSNEPEIRDSHEADWTHDSKSGTSITLHMDASFRARSSLHKYIEHTAIVNPHATIELTEPKREVRYERTVDELPEQPTEIKPHPHGIEFGTLQSLIEVTDSHSISGFLQTEFTRVGETTAQKIIDAFMDRVHGRYCQWAVPEPSMDVPKNAIESGIPYLVGDNIPDTLIEPTDAAQTEIEPGSESEAHGTEMVSFTEYIEDHINRKSQAATTAFASQLAEELSQSESASWVTVRTTTERIADTVEQEESTTLGETVREKAAEATWRFIRTTRKHTLYTVLEETTSDRKTDEDVAGFTNVLHSLFEKRTDTHDAIGKDGLYEIVEDAASKSGETISNRFGETAQENVFDALWTRMDRSQEDPPLLREVGDDRGLSDHLHGAMQEVDVMAPPSHCLSPIGEENIVQGMKKVYDADFYAGATRDASVQNGEPFLIEAGVAHGGSIDEDGDIELLRFANRVPLVYKQGGCAITAVVSSIRWNNYKLSDKGSGLPQGPVAIVVHVASTNVPFTSESKDAVASVNVIKDEIEKAVREVARDLKSHLKEQRSLQKRRRKQDKIAEILPEFANKIAGIKGTETPSFDRSLAQIMNNLFVTVETTEDTSDSVRVRVQNFNDRSQFTPEITLHTNEKPDCESLELVVDSDDDDGWTVTWNPTVSAGGEAVVELPIAKNIVTDISLDEIPDEKLVLA